MGKKAKKSCVCHECEVEFDIVITSSPAGRHTPQICPFCGDSVDIKDDRPFLKDFDEYDEFDDDGYYTEDEDDLDDED
jgi:hypothetical protein